MFRNCLRVVALGLLAAVSASAQRANSTDLSGHYVEYDVITMAVQTQMEALEPVVKALNKPAVTSSYTAWVDKFQSAAKAGTMSVQKNADNLAEFLTAAAAQASSFAADSKAALSKAPIQYFKFHAFMPAATYDVVEYGILRISLPSFNASSLSSIRAYMTKSVGSEPIQSLEYQLDAYIKLTEKTVPGFRAAIVSELNKVYRDVWANNPTRAPTASTSTSTPSVTSTSPTRTPTNGTASTNSTTTTTNSSTSTTTAPATTLSPELYIGEPMPEDESATAPTAVPTPAPTTQKSGVASLTAASAVVGAVVFAVASALV